jgi:hypothetical protein
MLSNFRGSAGRPTLFGRWPRGTSIATSSRASAGRQGIEHGIGRFVGNATRCCAWPIKFYEVLVRCQTDVRYCDARRWCAPDPVCAITVPDRATFDVVGEST